MIYINRAASAAGFLLLLVVLTISDPVRSESKSAADKVCVEKPWTHTLTTESWNFHQRALELYRNAGLAPRTNLQIVRADAPVGFPLAIACHDFRHIVMAHPMDARALDAHPANPALMLAYWTAAVIAESGQDSRHVSQTERRRAETEAAARMNPKRNSNK